MNKIKLGIGIGLLLMTTLACQSKKNSEDNQSSDKKISTQELVENGIRRIDDTGKSDSITTTLELRMKELNVIGVSITVFDNNEILWSKGYGYSNKKNGEKVTENTLFQAASISKSVASVGAFKLIEQNRFDLDENVNLILKRWQVPENEFTTNEKVTASRIMSHTSGLSTSGFQGYEITDSIPTLKQILEGSSITNSEPVRVVQIPGESERYSGGGMTVLQMLMEDVSGQEFPNLMDSLVLNPAGMTNSTFAYPIPEKIENNISMGYDESGNEIQGGYHIYPEKAAAGLWSNPTDLAKFMIALGKSYRGEENSILKQSSAKKMMTRVPNAGATGIGIDGEGNAFRFRHTGGNAGFKCYAVSFANNGRGVVIMTNSDNAFPLIHEIVRAVSEEYDWPPMWMRE